MRFRDFVATVIISTCTCLLVVWALISAGIIQTQQQTPQQQLQPIKQTHTGTLTGIINQTSGEYEAYITKIPIQNVTNTVSVRLLHISLEANITNYDSNGRVEIHSFQLKNQLTKATLVEKNIELLSTSYVFLAIDMGVNPIYACYIHLKATGDYNFMLEYELNIIQEIFD